MTDRELIKQAEHIKKRMLQDTAATLVSIIEDIKVLVNESPLHYKADLLRSIDLVLYRYTNFKRRFQTGLILQETLSIEEQRTVDFLLDILDPIFAGDVKSLDRILSPSDTKMTFDLEFESVTPQERQRVIDSLNNLTFGDQGIKIKRVDKGSVIFTIELVFSLLLRWYSLYTSGLINRIINSDDNIIQTNIEHSLLAKLRSIEFDITSAKKKYAETFIRANGYQLYDLNLSRLNLNDLHLPYANFSGSNLLDASFSHASIEFANLNNTYLVGCSFMESDLGQTSFEKAYAQSAMFWGQISREPIYKEQTSGIPS
ncbi:pentapeptide repeat-containing protein [Paraflavitalea speifideaquila]|uniref:pentapeptide repeat-containing protein n=1 Tax=Paraflavitalea speifideaquila TaxID=3076558 RepID=UPI0028E9FAD1|nr:pentapeptide repeat-containing protein [Paraflavitalea speifideiaquila]